jgi:hypothetical protein
MTQLNSIQINGFQKDVFAVFNKYGMDVNEGFQLLRDDSVRRTRQEIVSQLFKYQSKTERDFNIREAINVGRR